MDCSITESTIVPTPSAISVCENQSTYYVSTPMRHLADFSNDQLSPKTNKYEHTEKEVDKENKSSTQSTSELTNWYTNFFHQLWRSTLVNVSPKS
ncbi:unnamed protein product [Adineta steineri]|uniref:Uncharacterized protein n=1 Tax=Adineta steineri TaxID=433720 RepID=A0A820RUN6_9BILA|nr:unnamed protein product [Adineta steineri]